MSRSLILSAPCCGKCQRHAMTNATALLFQRQEHQLPVTHKLWCTLPGKSSWLLPKSTFVEEKMPVHSFVAEMKTKINDWLFLSLTCKVKLLFHSVIMSSAEKYTPSEVMVSSGEICSRINLLPFFSLWGWGVAFLVMRSVWSGWLPYLDEIPWELTIKGFFFCLFLMDVIFLF